MGREFRDDCGFIINVIAKKFTIWGPNNQDPLGFYDNSSESKIKNQNIKRGQLTIHHFFLKVIISGYKHLKKQIKFDRHY